MGAVTDAPCPITGAAPKRFVQRISARLLVGLWRRYTGVDVSGLFAGIDRVTLYESPCGLWYFDPPVVGDGDFYRRLYGKFRFHELTAKGDLEREEYRRTARHVPAGATLAEIGCGSAGLRRVLPGVRYVGLDPFAPEVPGVDIVRESAAEHAVRHAGHYDAVAAFQVIEHVAEPLAFARDMVRLLKPGGVLILGAPLHPSPITELPNGVINAPPHHTSWWNCRAFEALAQRLGLTPVEIAEVPLSPHQALLHWWHRFTPVTVGPQTGGLYFAHRWRWHAALAAGLRLGRFAAWLRPRPARTRPVDVMLVARKP